MANIRLVNETNRCGGIVEIFHDDQWGTICVDRDWKKSDSANVVCKELGCGKALYTKNYPGQSSQQTWLERVNCNGIETSLKNCGHSPWGDIRGDNCARFVAGVVCSSKLT